MQRLIMLIGSLLPAAFGAVMMFAPHLMLDSSLTSAPDDLTITVTRWAGFAVFSVGAMTFLARNDRGSEALRAILIGNIAFHVLGIAMDSWGFALGTVTTAGLITSLVPHTLLAAAFAFLIAAGQGWVKIARA